MLNLKKLFISCYFDNKQQILAVFFIFYIVIRKIMLLFFLVKYPGAAVFAELIY